MCRDKAIEARSLSFDKLAVLWKAEVPRLNAIEEASAIHESITGKAILKMHSRGMSVEDIAEIQSESKKYVELIIERGPQDWWEYY